MKRLLLLAALLAAPAAAQTDPARLSADVRTLASDAFEGRAPGTSGETKTVDWLVARFKALDLQPGGRDGSWTQASWSRKASVEIGGKHTTFGLHHRLSHDSP